MLINLQISKIFRIFAPYIEIGALRRALFGRLESNLFLSGD